MLEEKGKPVSVSANTDTHLKSELVAFEMRMEERFIKMKEEIKEVTKS